ncbi:MAG: hypothetical protein R3293_25165, partial [Candidatus Promineifilaceae bacterium]|nr:hypothetical protein [Candidatus Promineifilaceae bacterium]
NLDPQQVYLSLLDYLYTDYGYVDYRWVISRLFLRYIRETESGNGTQYVRDLYKLFHIRLTYSNNGQPPANYPMWWDNWYDVEYYQYQSSRGWLFHTAGSIEEIFEQRLQQLGGFDAPEDYSFEVFPYISTNVGLRLIYRQEWKPLGRQIGEIVRTIPLGPGQTERVTTKIIRRHKRSSTMETVTESESTTESTESTKDSNEIVNEAAETFKWNLDAKVGASFVVTAEASTSLGETSEEKYKQTNSHLSEAMRKASSKIRRETKTIVSTESETSFEQEHFSEISNPNNEIAITYEYHKIQQQYEVFTYLAEVQSVIFVAEYVPKPSEIDEEWVRKYDWIIAKALKDESFSETLNDMVQDVDEENVNNQQFADMLKKAVDKFASFQPHTAAAGGGGLSVPDIFSEPQRVYQEQVREKALRDRANRLRQKKRQRLFQHLRDNILYYCRAIWAEEDSDQRFLRYKKENRRVPVKWSLDVSAWLWEPTGEDAPLWDLIDPTGPLGFVGNYAVYGLRPLPEAAPNLELARVPANRPIVRVEGADLNAVLSLMRAPYLHPNGTLYDPALNAYQNEASEQKELDDEEVEDFLSYMPKLTAGLVETDEEGNIRVLRNSNGELENPVSAEHWGEYIYRKNATRRFLVDSNNLYLNISTGEGAALEPFKRAHRYIDVLKAYEELQAMKRKNLRRDKHIDQVGAYDPDIEKIIILGQNNSMNREIVAVHESLADSNEIGTPSTENIETTESSVASTDGSEQAENSVDQQP